MRRALAMSGVVLTVTLAACSGSSDNNDATRPETSSSSSTTTSTSPTSTPTSCEFDGGIEREGNARATETQYLTDVTTSSDGCIDTVTFTFEPSASPAPSYRVEYSPGPFRNSAGDTANPGGTVFLTVRFEPAWIADLSQESAPLTYEGPRAITPTGMKSVRGLALFDASEAVVAWVVGLDAQRPFTVEGTPGKVVLKVG